MSNDIERWNARYLRGETTDSNPSPLLLKALNETTPGFALDLASGNGRHALYLAANGWQVTAVDGAPAATELLEETAREEKLGLRILTADLELGEFQIEPQTYDLICNFYYLQRNLFPSIREGLIEGGLFVAAIHMVDLSPDVPPMNPNFLLKPDELREQFATWEVLHYEEAKPEDSSHKRLTAEIIARRPRVN